MITYLDFEKPIAELESKISDLRAMSEDNGVNVEEEVGKLQLKLDGLLREIYAELDPWQKTQVARHPDRPHMTDYVNALIEDFTPLAGDRSYAEDNAILGGLGRFRDRTLMVIGHEKGRSTKDRVAHNFGMARPEGYRKTVRLMDMADRFDIPILTLIDTPGAYPGIGAEERGQAEAIARCTEQGLKVRVPLIAVIIGEGGSGGAVALATGNRVMILEHAIYSVISPEGCASILWRSAEKARTAAQALKLTAQDLKRLGAVDTIIPEPVGGAHRDPLKSIEAVCRAIAGALDELHGLKRDQLKKQRYDKFMAMNGG